MLLGAYGSCFMNIQKKSALARGAGFLSGYQAQVQLCVAQEINIERHVLGKRKDSFLEEASNPGKKVDSCPEEPTHHWWSGGKSF